MSILLGAGGVKNVKEIYVGVDGKPRKVKEGYVGVNGAPRLFYRAAPPLPPKGTTLEQCTWEQIRMIADAGLAAQYFKVGDTKSVLLKGTASKLSLNTTYYVYILGFDHDGNKNTIDFGTFKDASGKDICLISGFSGDSDFYMNTSHTNAGGWKNSYMRNTILGSTKAANGNAGTDTATSPKANTLMSCLPAELRAVMKPMTIYTDNVGGGSDSASNVTATVDYLPLLAEYEIFGSNSYANTNETSHQTQYEYFRDGGSKVKYRSDSTGSTAGWWERSPIRSYSRTFCLVSSNGNASNNSAGYSYGVAPAFRV